MSEQNQGHSPAVVKTGDEDRDWEAEARAEGWVPEAEWEGEAPRHGFLEAREFVKRGEEIGPILKAKNKRMEGELQSLRAELADIKGSAQRFNDFAQKAIDRERREKQAAMERLEQTRAQAISEGDGQKVIQTERELDRMRREPDPMGVETRPYDRLTPDQQQTLQQFISENDWYAKDPHMRSWADGRAVALQSEGVPLGKPILDRIASEAREVWAGKFPGQNRRGAVEGNSRRVAESFGRRTWDDLPPEAKRAYDDFKRVVPSMTKAQYLAQYEWE